LTGPPAGQPPFGVDGSEMDGKINGDMVKAIGDTERVADGSGIQNSKEESKNDITYGWEQRIDPATRIANTCWTLHLRYFMEIVLHRSICDCSTF
jgi:hypothetical protein